jgi:hypothetical protein
MKSGRNSLFLSAISGGKSYLANKIAQFLISRNKIKIGDAFFSYPYESGNIWPNSVEPAKEIISENRIKNQFHGRTDIPIPSLNNVVYAALARLSEINLKQESIVFIDWDIGNFTFPSSLLSSKRNVLVAGLFQWESADLFDYIFVGFLTQRKMQQVWQAFFTFMSFDEFEQIHQKVTLKYGFLVLDKEKNTMYWTNAKSPLYHTDRDVQPLTSLFHFRKRLPLLCEDTLELLNFDFRMESECEQYLNPFKGTEVLLFKVVHFQGRMAVEWVTGNLIQKLHLITCGITDQMGTRIAQALRSNRGLQSLNLKGNFMANQSAKAFSRALTQNTTLKFFDINYNHDQGDWKLFLPVIRKNKTLQTFFFASNMLKDYIEISNAFERYHCLFETDLWDNSKNRKFAHLRYRFAIFFFF